MHSRSAINPAMAVSKETVQKPDEGGYAKRGRVTGSGKEGFTVVALAPFERRWRG